MKHGLNKIRVIDFSSEIAGPYVTKLFADAGADVIKVEAPEDSGAEAGPACCIARLNPTRAPARSRSSIA